MKRTRESLLAARCANAARWKAVGVLHVVGSLNCVALCACASAPSVHRRFEPVEFADGAGFVQDAPKPQAAGGAHASSPAVAAAPAKDGFYLAGFAARSQVSSSDLDGSTVLTDGSGVILLPELDDGDGFGFAVGARTGSNAWELSYVRTDHDVQFLGASGEAQFCTFNLDFKHYFRTEHKLQPNLLFGLAIPTLTVEDGASDGVTVDDGEFIGIGLNLGAGLSYFFNPHVGLVSQLVYRYADLTSAEGGGMSGTIEDGVDVSGLDLRLGLSFTF